MSNKWLYLFKVKKLSCSETGFELYFVPKNNDEPEPICKAYPESDLYNQVKDLYNAASESSRHVKLSDTVLGTINFYMNPEDIEL